MAESIRNMETIYQKKNFTYVPPTPPTELIESTNFTINFTERKFLHVGLNPAEKFDVSILIITSSRFVKISVDFLRRIFSLMGQILSYILDTAVQNRKNIFLDTESISVTSMVYKGETVLVIESKTQVGCRILLNQTDLITIQHLEWAIFENSTRKIKIIRPIVLDQLETLSTHFFSQYNGKTLSMDDMVTIIASSRGEDIQKTENCILSELRLFAAQQIATRWYEKQEAEELKKYSQVFNLNMFDPSPPRYSAMSPMLSHDEDFSQALAVDEDRGIDEFLTQINPTQSTWAPTKSS
ncbi:uncharacterized protein LOC111027116, partial [Myzus persicae]|uniref:uncharacterized protein LOC111027116 n=1 Tax=Myzus persicae TaxID=13164 RepID=UPI000B937ABE